VNGTGRTGLGAGATTALQSIGFQTLQPANAPATRTTTITYPAGRKASAEAVAAHVPGATLREAPTSGGDVVLTLGTDGAAVQTSPTTASSPTPCESPAPSSAQAFTTGSCIN